MTDTTEPRALLSRLRASHHLTFLLDYDGTLVPFRESPALAVPDQPLLDLLAELAAAPNRLVHIASGRTRRELEGWFGALPIGLWAEHGAWRRRSAADVWEAKVMMSNEWMADARAILDRAVASAPGALVEEKQVSLAWHYRRVDPAVAQRAVSVVRAELGSWLDGRPLELLEGSYVIEIRPAGVNKGKIVHEVATEESGRGMLVAVGDDRTDEDMFAALPGGSVAVRVGEGLSLAPYRLPDPWAVRALLRELA